MAFPKDDQRFEHTEGGSHYPWSDTAGIHEMRTDKLCYWLYKNLRSGLNLLTELDKRMDPILKKSDEGLSSSEKNSKFLCVEAKNAISSLFKEEERNKQKGSGSENRLFLRHTRHLGIFLMSPLVYTQDFVLNHDLDPFRRDLEVDCRGRVECHGKTLFVELGEIKSSTKSFHYAAQQLMIRLAFVAWAVYAVSLELKSDIELRLSGKIFIPFSKNPPSLEGTLPLKPGLPPLPGLTAEKISITTEIL